MREALARLDYDKLPNALEVTLTYPGEWQTWCSTGAEAKRQLRVLLLRFARKYGEVRPIWKLEFQRRGAPHFHMVLSQPSGATLTELRGFFADHWFDIVGSGDERHHQAGIELSRVRSKGALSAYFAGYLTTSKRHQEIAPAGFRTGRWWNVPREYLSPEVVFALSPAPIIRAHRAIGRLVARKVRTHRHVRAQTVIVRGDAARLADRLALHVDA